MLTLHRQLATAKTAHNKTVQERQIDRLVYEIYGPMEEESAIVEGGGEAVCQVSMYHIQ